MDKHSNISDLKQKKVRLSCRIVFVNLSFFKEPEDLKDYSLSNQAEHEDDTDNGGRAAKLSSLLFKIYIREVLESFS